jgi:hypothetical protein
VEPDFLSVFLVGSQVQQLPSLQRRHLSYCRPLWNGRHVLDTTRPPSADCSVPGLHAATIAGVLHSLVVPILSLSQVFSFVMIFSCQSHWQRFSGFGTSCTNYQYATAVVLISARVFMHSRTFFPMVIAAFSLPIIIVLSPSSSSTVTQFRLIQTVEAEAIAPPRESNIFFPQVTQLSCRVLCATSTQHFPRSSISQVDSCLGRSRSLHISHRLRAAIPAR